MYKDFFGLNGSPFELSPDPFFMVSSENSKEVLASISGAVGRRKGFVVMTGEVGTGKTLILRCLFELWEREQIPFAYFIGPRLSTIDFLSYINFELGIKVAEPSKGNLLRALYGFLLAQFEKGLTTILIIDEAHQVPRSVLEEIRLLTNFETAQQKLVQIVLVGQPELDRKLDSVELRSLKQRIAVRCQLEPLRAEEIRNYIERRLGLAGADSQATSIFPVETVKAIHRYSLGIPRLVNNICDQALIAACTSQVRVVPVEVIHEIASRFRLEPAPNLKQTERPFSPASQLESSAPDKSWQAVPALNVPTVKAPDPDAVLSYLDVGNGTPAQTAPPSKPETSHKSSLRDDSTPYEHKLKHKTIDRDKIPEVLTEFDLQSLNGEAKAVCLPSGLPALSDAPASVTTTSEARPPGSTQDSALAAESNFLAACEPVIGQTVASAGDRRAICQSDQIVRDTWPPTTTKHVWPNPAQVILHPAATLQEEGSVPLTAAPKTETHAPSALNLPSPSDTQTLHPLPKTAARIDPQGIAAKNPPRGPGGKPAAPAAIQPPALHTSAEALKLESARLQEELSSLWAALSAPNAAHPAPAAPAVNKPVTPDSAAKVLEISDAASLLAGISCSASMAALRANHKTKHFEVQEVATLPAAQGTETATSPELPFGDAVASENTIGPDRASTRNNKGILISAVAAGFLVLAAGSARYLRRPSSPAPGAVAAAAQAGVASSISRGITPAQANPQSAAPSAQPISVKTAANTNSELFAYKQLAEPAPAPKKPLLGQVRLATPSVNRSAKSPDVGDPGAAPLMDGQVTPNADGLSGGLAAAKQALAPPTPLQVGGDVKPARMISSISPVYPSLAKNQHIDGDVRIDALIDANGRVSAMKVVSGPALLQQAAMESLHQWKYQPATLDGKPVPMHLTVTIQFRMK
jgi:general secretion pathway protein A